MKTWTHIILIFSICATIIIVFICITLFAIKFLPASRKQDMGTLGQMGDFIGGTLGTLASVIGVALTAFIAINVNRLQAKLSRMSMDHSLKLIRYQTRQQKFISFLDKCDKVFGELSPDIEAKSRRSQLSHILEAADRISVQFKESEGERSLLFQLAKNSNLMCDQIKHLPTTLPQHIKQVKLTLLMYKQSVFDLSQWVETGKIKWTTIGALKSTDYGHA